MILGVDRLSDVVQQRGREKLLIVGKLVTGAVVHLQAVVQRIALRMIFERLPHILER